MTTNSIFKVAASGVKQGMAHVRIAPTRSVKRNTDGRIYNEWFPGEVVFQWGSKSSKRPDFVCLVGYYPVVSNRVKDFIESSGLTGLDFFRASEIPAGLVSFSPVPTADVWWAMCPSARLEIDIDRFCGPGCSICPLTNHFLSSTGAPTLSSCVVLNEDVETNFFGVRNLPWYPGIYCLEKTRVVLEKQKFKNLILSEAGCS